MAPNNSNERTHFNLEQLVAPCGRQQLPPPKDNKVEQDNNLGTYSAAVTPLMTLSLGLCCGTVAFKDFPIDPRVKGWFLIECPISMVVIAVLYILFSTVWGPRYMKNRKPMQLKKLMIVYNFFQVVFSFYMFCETAMSGWLFDYNYRCQPCDYSLNPQAVRMTRVAQWYFLSKILDFVDTALFIVRGKLNQVTHLHVIHHSSMFTSMWFGMHHTPGGHITFMGFLNTFVHTVMYSYYLLSALGPKVRPYLWWKRYLTRLQLIQFVAIFLHAAQLLVFPCKGVPTLLVLWTLLYAFMFFALFINFYIKAYLFGGKKKIQVEKKESAETRKITNGIKKKMPYSNGVSEGTNGTTTGRQISNFIDSATTHRLPRASTVIN